MSGEGAEPPALDLARILDVLDRYQVDYLLVGGVSANAYGASRRTSDFDCLPDLDRENLRRVAAALMELNARLRVEGLSDEESRALPVQVDETTLASMDTEALAVSGFPGPPLDGGCSAMASATVAGLAHAR